MRTKQWIYRAVRDPSQLEELAHRHALPSFVAQFLYHRGISGGNLRSYCNPTFSELHSPFLLEDMERAVERLVRALRERERIMLYGDYDADGLTSLAVLYHLLESLHADLVPFVPDRLADGYGFSIKGVEEARKLGCGLIITVDSGITSYQEVIAAQEVGIDVIITDHHNPGEELPAAYAVVTPRREGSSYPFPDLAGVGVAFKLAQGLLEWVKLSPERLERLLDLVALGTAADVVPLVDENRAFVKIGLEKLNQDPLMGLDALIRASRLNEDRLEMYHLVYILAPRINAAGRLGIPQLALQLLLSRRWEEAQHYAQELCRHNEARQRLDNQIKDEVKNRLEKEFDPDRDYVIVLESPSWHQGVLGIAASWVAERYYRPTVLISVSDGQGKGSARSIPGFNLFGALQQCSSYLIQFGGHTYAAGLLMKEEAIPEFRQRLNQIAREMMSPEDLIPKIYLDGEIDLTQLDIKAVHHLQTFAPFGLGNPEPVFACRNVLVSSEPRRFKRNVVRFTVTGKGQNMEAVMFNVEEEVNIAQGARVDLAFRPILSSWNGQTKIQLEVKDIKFYQ